MREHALFPEVARDKFLNSATWFSFPLGKGSLGLVFKNLWRGFRGKMKNRNRFSNWVDMVNWATVKEFNLLSCIIIWLVFVAFVADITRALIG